MAHFAVLNSDNLVVNVIVCDSKELAEQITNATCIEYDWDNREAGVDWKWDGSKFYIPEPEVVDAVIVDNPQKEITAPTTK